MTSGEQIAQAAVNFIGLFAPTFIVMVVVEWALGFFRRDR